MVNIDINSENIMTFIKDIDSYNLISERYDKMKSYIIRVLKNADLYNDYIKWLAECRNSLGYQLDDMCGADFNYLNAIDKVDNESYIKYQLYFYHAFCSNSVDYIFSHFLYFIFDDVRIPNTRSLDNLIYDVYNDMFNK